MLLVFSSRAISKLYLTCMVCSFVLKFYPKFEMEDPLWRMNIAFYEPIQMKFGLWIFKKLDRTMTVVCSNLTQAEGMWTKKVVGSGFSSIIINMNEELKRMFHSARQTFNSQRILGTPESVMKIATRNVGSLYESGKVLKAIK